MLTIPRVFHRFWDRPPMPEKFERFGAGWLALHPDWRMCTWNDGWGGVLPPALADTYRRQPCAAGQADVLRMAILERFGGVWLDTDFECLRNIEPLLDGVSCFAASEEPLPNPKLYPLVSTAILGAEPEHPVFVTAARLLATEWQPSDDLPLASGPKFFTRMLIEHNLRSAIRVFPPTLFYPLAYGEPEPQGDLRERFPAAYAVHHWAASWKGG